MYLKHIRAKDLGEALTQTKRLFHAFWNTSLTYKLMYHIVIIYLCIRYQYCLLNMSVVFCIACGLRTLSNSMMNRVNPNYTHSLALTYRVSQNYFTH